MHTVWTIGHSTRSLEELTAILKRFEILHLIDVRHFPGSRKFPHFNKEALSGNLPLAGIQYQHLVALGGRRKAATDSLNTGWRHPAFRGYADYMETEAFKDGLVALKEIASKANTAFMCSEAVWWRCHRALIADQLKAEGWKVLHILNEASAKEHPYTAAARIVDGKLSYRTNDLFS